MSDDPETFHKPVRRPGELFDRRYAAEDPAEVSRVAHSTASALLARVRARTRTYSGDSAAANELQIADLRLNRLSRRVERNGREITLTTKEFSLLEFLMMHAEQVLSRTQLGEHVWGYDYYNQSNVVDVYVGYLRRKIDDGQAFALIHTVRGVGYKLSAEG